MEGLALVNVIYKDWNPFRNKFYVWIYKHKWIRELDHEDLFDDKTGERVGGIALIKGNKILVKLLSFLTEYHFSKNCPLITVKDFKIESIEK